MSSTRIQSFHRGTTKTFDVVLSIDGVVQNITGDTVTVNIKRRKVDVAAIIEQSADVATDGANGRAIFKLLSATTEIEERKYVIDIRWIRSGGDQYVIYDDEIDCLPRVSD